MFGCFILGILLFTGANGLRDYEYRLPKALTPLVYELKLTFDSQREEVFGEVTIQFQCEEETNRIELHIDPLYVTIWNSTLENRLLAEKEILGIPAAIWDLQVVRWDLNSELIEKHVYYLNILFTTKYSSDRRGLMRNEDLMRGKWLNTQFEPSHARRLVPSFDEPNWRASFDLEITLRGEYADPEMVALSAMSPKSIIRKEEETIWSFSSTPPIPIYLFSLAIGRFRSVCNNSALLQKEICIWRFSHWKDWNATAQILIDAIARYQEGVTDYLWSDPIARLHFLIVPSTLKGMENFGLLNIRENLWPDIDDVGSFRIFARTLYHEMAHQWFGNLVTMEWWSDIWLSESLTTYLSSEKPISIDPSNDRTVEPLVNALWSTGIPSIAYTKGAAILEMLDAILGQGKMAHILREYIRRHQFGYATTDDFISVVQTVTNRKKRTQPKNYAVEFLRSWLLQGGHPIVFVDYDRTLRAFYLTQEPKMHNKVEWYIPVWTDCVRNGGEKLHWIVPGKQLSLKLDDLTETGLTDAVAFNRNHPVYYQISYRY